MNSVSADAPAAGLVAERLLPDSDLNAPVSSGQERSTRLTWSRLLPMTALSILFAFAFSKTGWYTAGDNLGYTLGIVGGLMILILLLYPLRKYIKQFRDWGPVKYWFGAHMVLGVAGPVLILAHSTFRLGSTNSAVALICMLVVAASGIVGRFLYTKVHRGLYGEKINLLDIQTQTGEEHVEMQTMIVHAPGVHERLKIFEEQSLHIDRNPLHEAWHFLLIGFRRANTYRKCVADLRAGFAVSPEFGALDDVERKRQLTSSRRYIREYLASAQRVARFRTYDRLLALWHVAHVPLVYLLLISGIAHVVSVFLY